MKQTQTITNTIQKETESNTRNTAGYQPVFIMDRVPYVMRPDAKLTILAPNADMVLFRTAEEAEVLADLAQEVFAEKGVTFRAVHVNYTIIVNGRMASVQI